MKRDLYAEVSARIIAELERGARIVFVEIGRLGSEPMGHVDRLDESASSSRDATQGQDVAAPAPWP